MTASSPLKFLLILLTHLLSGWLLWRGFVAAPWWMLVPALLAGHLLLDFVTLLTHWTIDNYFTPRTPLLGTVVYYFREHHAKPMEMFKRGYIENNFENALMGLGFQLLIVPLHGGPFVDLMFGIASFGACYITLIHKWTHLENPGRLGSWLQRLHLVVGKPHHDTHHRGEGRAYGLAAGWCDGIVDRIHLIEGLEWLIYVSTGAVPVIARLETLKSQAAAHQTESGFKGTEQS